MSCLFEHNPNFPDTWVQLEERGWFFALGDDDRLDIVYHPEFKIENSVLYEEIQSEFIVKSGLQLVARLPVYEPIIDYSADVIDVYGQGLEPVNAIHELWLHSRHIGKPPAECPHMREPL
ncbi:hypothetical protein [Mycobacterium sp. NPDC050853]|uniref:hypothetical protein n=1 Tax=Mycobacterium sp. NPDC050853 TaxID=3155160 RepID=UPI0033C63351